MPVIGGIDEIPSRFFWRLTLRKWKQKTYPGNLDVLIPFPGVPLHVTNLWHRLCKTLAAGILHSPSRGQTSAARGNFKWAALPWVCPNPNFQVS